MLRRFAVLFSLFFVALHFMGDFLPCNAQEASSVARTVSGALATAIETAGENGSQLEQALAKVPADQWRGMQFLIENMPASDLKSLTSDFLLEHVRVAYAVRSQAKWGEQIPEDVFFNEVLPYANVNEKRDAVRQEFYDKFWPVVKDLESPSLAAAKLNQEVFQQLSVKYSTKRRRADQGPRESMETGLASCTGLSVLLIDACRACGVPARFVGTPLWSDGSGNHSWVEVWDHGWHFTGAAEPTGDELDKAWFTGRAATATIDDPRHGIFAVSYRKTSLRFPLVWARGGQETPEVYAVDVTDRYAKPQKAMPKGYVELQFRALQPGGVDRCRANLLIRDSAGQVVFRGQTNDESFDANDHVIARLKPGEYEVELSTASGLIREKIVADQNGKLVTLKLVDRTDPTPPVSATSPAVTELAKFLKDGTHSLQDVLAQDFADNPLTRLEAEESLALLGKAHFNWVQKSRKAEHESKVLKIGDLEMPYGMKVFGDAPVGGHSLVISMHGGGGAPKRVNDQQWENQKSLYKLEEGIYVAPRAPTDTWNLWHQGHIDAFFTRLIENMLAFENVNPNRVFITGYSAGGDGVFQLAPRMADQLAAAAMMAGHPNETKPDGLRNLPFTLHMGANDAAYDRNKKAADWQVMLADLKKSDPLGYEHWVEIHDGKGHWMDRQDAEGVKWMAQFSRNIIPQRVVWLQDDVLHDRFYWLAVNEKSAPPRAKIVATRDGNTINIESADVDQLTVLLRDDMLDLEQPVRISFAGRELFYGKVTRSIANLVMTLKDRGDTQASFSASVSVDMR